MAKAQPYKGDIFTTTDGRIGVVTAVLDSELDTGLAVDVQRFDDGTLSSPSRTTDIMVKDIQIRRPPIGGQFGLDTRELDTNRNTVEVVRHLENGCVELRVVVHSRELIEPAEGFLRIERRSPADPFSWPIVELKR